MAVRQPQKLKRIKKVKLNATRREKKLDGNKNTNPCKDAWVYGYMSFSYGHREVECIILIVDIYVKGTNKLLKVDNVVFVSNNSFHQTDIS